MNTNSEDDFFKKLKQTPFVEMHELLYAAAKFHGVYLIEDWKNLLSQHGRTVKEFIDASHTYYS